ncbi:DUF2341 domain-containing protein [Methanobacterium ferruginis]|uniref:DUF2341 domain-containing protein n=1 Tax=Methanobacterium ferruginis TaxID=710191 RepID=UPI0025726DC8|nr:DUF2341 domain-containing protein [Methanobacterium ferruginis]BDZ68610.1 hypothetical protein GCM10025860_20580 [Methanobacterium ferruginis]
MTDVEVTGVIAETGAAEAIPGNVITRVMDTSLDFLDINGRSIRELVFPSLFPGEIAEKEMIVINDGAGSIGITLQSLLSEVHPLGSDLETYLSTFFSIDKINWTNTLDINLNPTDTENVYIRYAPPSTSTVGEKQWTFRPLINDIVSGSPPGWDNFDDWEFYDYFPVTGNVLSRYNYPVAITIPYAASVINTDYSDIRFADDDGNELGYYIYSKTDEDTATFLVQLINMPEDGETIQVYVYSGNPNVLTTSDSNRITTWTGDWILNDETYPHYQLDGHGQWDNTAWLDKGMPLTAEFDPEDIKIHLTHGQDTEGTAHNINPISDDFTFKGVIYQGNRDLLFYFYQSSLNDLIIVSFRRRLNFARYWEIGKIVDGSYTILATQFSSPYESSLNNATVEIIVVKNTSITVKVNGTIELTYEGTFPQAGTGWGIYSMVRYYTTGDNNYVIKPAMMTGSETYDFPTAGNLTGTWKFLTKSLEIKAGILFKEQKLEGTETPQVKHGLMIDGHLYW